MICNGWLLRDIPAYNARRLPEGSEVIVESLRRDHKSYEVIEAHYYRAIVETRKTVAGPDTAIRSEPNAEWPEMPPWQSDWIWLEETPGFVSFFVADGRVE